MSLRATSHAATFHALAAFIALLVAVFPLPVAAETSLVPAWRTGMVYGTEAAWSHFAAGDVNGDRLTDIVACSLGSPFVLSTDGKGSYGTSWYGPNVSCRAVTLGDADHNGRSEIYVLATTAATASVKATAKLYEFEFFSASVNRSLSVPVGEAGPPVDITSGDVDDDGHLEIVTTGPSGTLVYDAATFSQEWSAPAYGGTGVKVGDVDGDAHADVIVNGNPSYFLNGGNGILKWAYNGGFGPFFDVADVDGDGRAEVLLSSGAATTISAVDAASAAVKWSVFSATQFSSLAVADMTGDGLPEVVTGDSQLGEVRVLRAATGTELWRVSTLSSGLLAVAGGDLDGDAQAEFVWAPQYGWPSNVLRVTNEAGALEWIAPNLDRPFHAAVGDVDGDGRPELIATSTRTNGNSAAGMLLVFDGVTHQKLWSIRDDFSLNMIGVEVGQLDNDPAKEIAEFGERRSWYSMVDSIEIYDFSKKAHETSIPLPARATAHAMANLGGVNDQIIVGLATNRVQVLDGIGPIVPWMSPILDGPPNDLSVADLTGSGTKTLGVVTASSAYLFETATWTLVRQISVTAGSRICLVPATTTHEAIVVVSNDATPSTVSAFSASTGAPVWQCEYPTATVLSLAVVKHGLKDMLAVGGSNGLLRLLPLDTVGDICALEENHDLPGVRIGELLFDDADRDGVSDLVLSSDSVIEIDHVPPPDVDGDGQLTVADVFYLINYIFTNGAAPINENGDENGDGVISGADVFALVNYLFRNGTS